MYSIVMIGFYFGKFPNTIDAFWKSVAANDTVDFILYTDIDCKNSVPGNVKIIPVTVKEFHALIQKKFPFKVAERPPYSLCALRPMFGYIFEDQLQKYDFWGFHDHDIVLGDIRQFFTEEVLDSYDMFLALGHMMLFRNKEEMKNLFRRKNRYGLDYKKILMSGLHTESWVCYEEAPYGIPSIAMDHGVRIYNEPVYADIATPSFTFRKIWTACDRKNDEPKIIQYFEWEKGKLYDCIINEKNVTKQEILYVHFQKRAMEPDIADRSDKLLFVPNIITDKNLTLDEIKTFCDIEKNEEYSYQKAKEGFLKQIAAKEAGLLGPWRKNRSLFTNIRNFIWVKQFWFKVNHVYKMPYPNAGMGYTLSSAEKESILRKEK